MQRSDCGCSSPKKCIEKPPGIIPGGGPKSVQNGVRVIFILCNKVRKTRYSKRIPGFYGMSVLMGRFEKCARSNGFSDFRAANFLVFTSHCSWRLFCAIHNIFHGFPVFVHNGKVEPPGPFAPHLRFPVMELGALDEDTVFSRLQLYATVKGGP